MAVRGNAARAVPADEAACIYDLARNWREATRLLNLRHGEHYTADAVQSAVNRSRKKENESAARAI